MGGALQAVRGMNDLLPGQLPLWQFVEQQARELFAAYGYQEFRVPLVEHAELFQRSIGEHTDIVEKEMYTFEDRGGDRLSLRPEATAGLVRAAIENGLLHNQKHRLWTAGPMFRHERPQQGRYRQFHQIDCEAFGYEGPDVDAEMILMSARLWRRLGIGGLRLRINSLGTPESRRMYRGRLVEYFGRHRTLLDADSLRRLEGNPLRILDSKNPALAEMIAGAPAITDHLDDGSRVHFERFQELLAGCGIAFTIDPRLVRGLDYYSRTVFEWTTTALGAQDAVCSGGRYDGLVAQLGGGATPAIGWALGVERLVSLMQATGIAAPAGPPGLYVVLAGDRAVREGLAVAERLRDALPGIVIEVNLGGGSFKSQLRRADRSQARLALIIGDDEVARRTAAIKSLRAEAAQQECAWEDLPARIGSLLRNEDGR
ncbi:MAG: histidine--tRNA ligase [Gammaproteobacteria bacterium]|nr:MAG: histidine--tRNA ligase [Gammaproteobacteria bacterium]